MATSDSQPLLDTKPKRKTFSSKTLYIFVASAAILCSIWFFTTGNYYNFVSKKSPNICEHAAPDQQESCLAVVSEVLMSRLSMVSDKTNDKVEILQMILGKTLSQIRETTELIISVHTRINNNDRRSQAALALCSELMDMSHRKIIDSMLALGNLTYSNFHDAHTWLSAVLTNHDTCMDELHGGQSTSTITTIESMLRDLMSRASASLALMVSIGPEYLHLDNNAPLEGDFPSWVRPEDRVLLLEDSARNINANVVVAKDGSGNYKTVQQAVDSAPNHKNDSRYVIYIKKGTYKEIVRINSSKLNVMLVGDGLEDTIITGSLNNASGTETFQTATVASDGDGFIAQHLRIQNTAGPKGKQAVALRVTGDRSIINSCKIDAYQDTLYAHNQRQFYKSCYITGTVDFIFGNAAVVLQKCNIVARKPGKDQKNMVTAQGRTNKNQNTGTTIQNCSVTPSKDLVPLKESIKTFLGRPWKPYATTVYIKSLIDDHIDPSGWAPWSGDDHLDTCYYGEYKNYGDGADTSKRVKWKGYHVITKDSEAKKFTVSQLLGDGSWIKDAGVSFNSGL